jgi:hypothetical protein
LVYNRSMDHPGGIVPGGYLQFLIEIGIFKQLFYFRL